MRLDKVVVGLIIFLLLLAGFNEYTQHAENQRLAEQKAADDAKESSALTQAQSAFSKGNYSAVRSLLEPYRSRGNEAISQLITNADKAELLAYQFEQSDFYKSHPPAEVTARPLNSGGTDFGYQFTEPVKILVEFYRDEAWHKGASLLWYGENREQYSKERESFVAGLVGAIYPQIEIPKLIEYIRANQFTGIQDGVDLPIASVNGVNVSIGVEGTSHHLRIGGGSNEELSNVVRHAPDAVECKVLVKEWLGERNTNAEEIATVLPNAKKNGRCYDSPSTSPVSELDPRNLFKVGAVIESNQFASMVDKNYPNAIFAPNQTIQVSFGGSQYVILTRKLSQPSKAMYEVLGVIEI